MSDLADLAQQLDRLTELSEHRDAELARIKDATARAANVLHKTASHVSTQRKPDREQLVAILTGTASALLEISTSITL